MKTKFSEMVIGAVFVDECDDPDFDQTLYKISETEAVNSETGKRQKIGPEAEYTTTGDVVRVYDLPTEIERAALTLLSQARVAHPVLAAWVQALCKDAGEMRWLSQFYRENHVPADGYIVSEDFHSGMIASIADRRPQGRAANTPAERFAWERDTWTFALAHAVMEYRERGRVDGDYSYTVSETGANLINVTTSLAAAVIEYTQREKSIALDELESEVVRAAPQEKRQMNIRASELLHRQIIRLGEKLGLNQNEVIGIAVDRMYQKEMGE